MEADLRSGGDVGGEDDVVNGATSSRSTTPAETSTRFGEGLAQRPTLSSYPQSVLFSEP